MWTRGFSRLSWRSAKPSTVARLYWRGQDAHESLLDLEVDDEDELVGLCEGEYVGLKAAFTLGGGTSMRVKHMRSYTEDRLLDEVEKRGGERLLVLPWLDAYNLRPLLRESPAVTKKAKVAEVIPPVVFGADQGNL